MRGHRKSPSTRRAHQINGNLHARLGMKFNVFDRGQGVQIIRRIVGFVLVPMMNILVTSKQPPKFVLYKNAMQGIQTLCVSFWMGRVSAAVFVTTAFTDAQNFKHKN